LSPHIYFGEISVVDVWTRIQRFTDPKDNGDLEAYLRQICWREFCYHLLHFWNSLPYVPLNQSFKNFPWVLNDTYLAAWKNGETGYPFVDAGMRQLRSIGWMHNRARMVTASFLVKQLLVPWQEGQAWFWESLVDADIANNAASWQWVAGCGVDAAPYFRIFNPVLQGKRFDSNGAYIRAWVPELRKLPDQWIHQPWCAPKDLMESAGIRLGHNYPDPIIDLDDGRRRALSAWKNLQKKTKSSEMGK
jgi:deoxyribodipyrimidine photo-lyase